MAREWLVTTRESLAMAREYLATVRE